MLNPARSRAACRWRSEILVWRQQGEVNAGPQLRFSVPPFVQSGLLPMCLFHPHSGLLSFQFTSSGNVLRDDPETCLPADSESGHPGVKTGSHRYLARAACYRLLLF